MGLCNRAGSAASTGFTAWGRSGSSKLKPRFRLSCALRGAGLRGAGRAAKLYDEDQPCGAEANAAKFLAADAAYEACDRAVRTHGGFGYAKEYHVERYLREIMIPRIAPVSRELIMCYIAEKVLGLPRSY